MVSVKNTEIARIINQIWIIFFFIHVHFVVNFIHDFCEFYAVETRYGYFNVVSIFVADERLHYNFFFFCL
jgi:hypothetical protein